MKKKMMVNFGLYLLIIFFQPRVILLIPPEYQHSLPQVHFMNHHHAHHHPKMQVKNNVYGMDFQ